jgi:toxin-antitoxin system PIN domain toxin
MPDVNLLVYAHRAPAVRCAQSQAWLSRRFDGSEPFALSALVAVAFVRILTNPRIFRDGMSTIEALAVIDEIRARPNCRVLAPGPRHLDIVADLCRRARIQGAQVVDAAHAAVAIEHGATWATFDRDFAVFKPLGLRLELLA